MAIMVQVEAVAKPGCTEQLVQMFELGFPDTRAADGCNSLTAYLGEDGQTFVVVESWESKAHYEAYLAWRTETGVMAALNALFQAPPNIRYFTAVDA